jgi:ribonuclease Z
MIEVTILGTSSATPTLDRHPSSQHLSINGKSYLIDCGEGAQIQMHRFGVRAARISKIFISHLHPDHILGLPGLLSSQSLEGRKFPLDIYAPDGLKTILETLFTLSGTFISYDIHYHILNSEPGMLVCQDSETEVLSYPVSHRVPCWAFLFREKKPPRRIKKEAVKDLDLPHKAFETLKRGFDFKSPDGRVYSAEEFTEPNTNPTSYAYVTDTLFLPGLADRLKGMVHMLYHESTYTNEMGSKATDRFHSTAGEAAEFARIVQADKLLIGHFSSRYRDLSTMLKEAREIFPETYLAEEGKSFSVAS